MRKGRNIKTRCYFISKGERERLDRTKLCVATKAFIVYNGKILLIRESQKYVDSSHQGKYDVPGSRVKPGERFDEGLVREVKEETGSDIKIGRPFFAHERRPIIRGEQWQIVAIFCVCSADTDGVVLSDDHDPTCGLILRNTSTIR